MSQTNGERPITAKGVQFALAIAIPLLALAVSWGAWTARINNLECRLAEQNTKLERYDSTLLTIQVQLAELQKDVTYIRKQLDEGTSMEVPDGRNNVAGDVGTGSIGAGAGYFGVAGSAVVQTLPGR